MTSWLLPCGHVRAYLAGRPWTVDGICGYCWWRQNEDEMRTLHGLPRELQQETRALTAEATRRHVARLAGIRADFRAVKSYALADEIRRQMVDLGAVVGDRGPGVLFLYAPPLAELLGDAP